MWLSNCDHYISVSNSYLDCFWTQYQIFPENLVFIFCRQCNLYNDTDGLVQERRNSIANTLELHLSCTNPLIWSLMLGATLVLPQCSTTRSLPILKKKKKNQQKEENNKNKAYLQTGMTSEIQQHLDDPHVTFVDPDMEGCLASLVSCIEVSSPSV